jgi:hypothetical protein
VDARARAAGVDHESILNERLVLGVGLCALCLCIASCCVAA